MTEILNVYGHCLPKEEVPVWIPVGGDDLILGLSNASDHFPSIYSDAIFTVTSFSNFPCFGVNYIAHPAALDYQPQKTLRSVQRK